MSIDLRTLELTRVEDVPAWHDLVFRRARDTPDAEALVFPDGRVTYGELSERIVDRARALVALGARPGDHVGLLMPSSLDYLECFFAVSAIGCVAILINSRYRSHELAYVVANADVRFLLVAGQVTEGLNYAERLCETFPDLAGQPGDRRLALDGAPVLEHVVLFGAARPGMIGVDAFMARGAAVDPLDIHRLRQHIRLRDPFMMMYTSGTTSMPKGCLLSHEAVVRTCQNFAFRYQMTLEDRFWSPLPLFHMGALNPLGACLWAGSAFICSPRFDPDEALDTLDREAVSVAFLGFPAIVSGLANHPDVRNRRFPRLRAITSSIASYPATLRDRLLEAFPDAVQLGVYGMTESAGTVTSTAVYDGREAGLRAIGRPVPGMRVRITREDGSEAAVGEAGEIHMSGYAIFSGYYRAPEKTSETIVDDWLHSGDLGYFNEHGELVFKSRIKDMLKVGGENVASAEIEAFINAHDAVKMCQVVGLPDDRMGEVPVAFVELHPGASATEQALIDFCDGRIAGFKVPRAVRFIGDWPLTASSKVQKNVLLDMLQQESAPRD